MQTLSAKPGIAIVKFWQGAVEIALRVAVVVLSFALLVSAGDTISILRPRRSLCRQLLDSQQCKLLDTSINSAGWLVFMALIAMLYEILAIIARFINFNFINVFGSVVFFVDMCISAVLAIALLIGGAVLASTVRNIPSHVAAIVFSFLLLLVLASLGAWMGLFLYKKWNNHLVQTVAKDEED